MSLLDDLKELGVNTEEALQRFMGNAAFYERMLGKLVAAEKDMKVMPLFEEQNYDAAFEAAHTLKGVTGNLSITPLYDAYTEICNLLRAGEREKAKAALAEILPVQEKIIACIESHQK